ncbi:MAG: response regulator transcription factor [Chloroflexi bacterium]|nr:response regulator transcription factor [Chloroflexota bacterium]
MIRILLAHPSRLVCDSLRTTLDNEKDVYVVGCATTAEELHFLLPHGNVVILGTEMGNATAIDLLADISMTHPQAKTLVLGVDERPESILSYIEAGASGYILQNESIEDTVKKLQAAHQEKAIISPSVAAALMKRLSCLAKLDTPYGYMEARETQLDELTSREEEVLRLLDKGLTNQEIANRLFIECGTVKNHVHNILKKLDVNNRHEAASILKIQQQSSLNLAV